MVGEELKCYQNKKVFITGHTGFKGTWLTLLLKSIGAVPSGFSLPPDSEPSHFDLIRDNINSSTFGDIRDLENLRKSMVQFSPHIVFHLAAQPLVRESYINPVNTYETNVLGTLNVLECIKSCPSIKAVVIITTDKVYENNEWLYPYREHDRLGGYDPYSSSKACTEILVSSFRNSFYNLKEYEKKHNILIATARAGNVIGGGDWSSDRLIPDVVRSAFLNTKTKIRSPNSIRPWQHVLDCLYGYLLLGQKLLSGNTDYSGSWNFAPLPNESKTVLEVLEECKKEWKRIEFEFTDSYLNPHEATTLKLDSSKSSTLLKWIPKWGTEEAILKTIEWYREFYESNKVITQNQIQKYLTSLKS
ncbi:CDP-glucose 4,6-dehydratase [Jiulongibacter sediminis]|uniref:CDP-glucose 4,6-dehydratase n=1 Tax=Jiulongibacter sediminis TaxID=1605367 RepID=UPI0026ECD9AD|nr:CDP-glucose 4,6-dehydratase [Jiulongibacter sediminis]